MNSMNTQQAQQIQQVHKGLRDMAIVAFIGGTLVGLIWGVIIGLSI